MTEQSQGWGASQGGGSTPVATAPAGWYPDPWSRGHHRYWDGATWTGGSFPHGPANPWADEGRDGAEVPPSPAPAPTPPPVAHDAGATPPPEWSAPTDHLGWASPAPTEPWSPAVALEDASTRDSRLPTGWTFLALVVGVMLVVGALGTVGGYFAFRHTTTTNPSASGLPPASPPADPDASVLQSLVLTQADVPSTVVVQPLAGGDQVAGQTTLDLCNGTYPSESLRTARLQVVAYDAEANPLLSTEAVLYTNTAATEQAFSELQSVVAQCPSSPVVSPVGEETVTTQFNAPPDGSWPTTTGVSRLAYDFTTTDDTGTTQHSVAVYLRRGRALMGVYFSQPDSPQITVAGASTIESIAAVFAGRLAALPASVVNG